jgi:hypothetical protein
MRDKRRTCRVQPGAGGDMGYAGALQKRRIGIDRFWCELRCTQNLCSIVRGAARLSRTRFARRLAVVKDCYRRKKCGAPAQTLMMKMKTWE